MNIQNKFKKTNTIYKITKDIDLEGSTLIIPVGCTLDFQGGSFKNGTINFNDTILSGDIKIKTRLTGSVKNNEISVLWFNVVGDGITDDRLAIQDVFDITPANSTVIFPRVSGFYKVVIGTGKGSTIIAQRADALANDTLYPIKISKDSVTVIVRGVIKSTTILGNMFELQGNSIVFIGEGGKLQGPGGEDTIGFLDTNTSDTTLQWHPSLLKVNGDNCNVSSLSFEDYPTHGIDCYGKALIVDSCLFIGGRVAHSTTGGTVLMGIRTNVGADSIIVKNNRFIANSKGGKCYSCVFPSGDNFIISNNICEKYHEHAVYAYGNYGSIIDNKFTDVNCIASDIQYFATYGSIKGNYSIGTEGFVQIMHGKGTIVEGNTVTNCRGGIIVRPYHTVDVDKLPSGLKLLNNYIELTAGTTGSCLSFYVLGTYDISDILISGNTFANGYYTQTSQVAASLLIGAGSSENNGIKFLRVENNVIRSGRGAVSWLKGIHNSIFKNNKFISETIDGVTSAFSSAINANYVTDTIFEGNEFIDLKETPTMARIIQLNTGTSNLTVSDNNIINYTSNIYLDYDTDVKIIYKNNNRRNYLSLAGSYDNKPDAYAQEYGVNYYDKDHQIPIWWSGVRWKDSLGSYVVLSKSDINTPNKLYRILFDIDLNGETLTLPANVTLDFQGGSFSNGTIVGSDTKIISNKIAFKSTIKLSGTFTGDLRTSWFEIDSSDCTDTLDSIFNVSQNCNVIIDEGVYNVSTKNLPRESLTTQYSIFVLKSNSNIVLNGTIKLLPNDLTNYQIFRLYNISNVIISGNGSIIGDVETHTGTTGEWGHGISISSSKHITIRDISISKCWGDGITVASYSEDNLSKDITIDNIVSTYNRRLGVSLISGDGIKFINSTTEGNGTINGTAPKMGLDIEPNPNETLNHVLVDNCLIKDKGTCYIPSTASVEDIDYKIMIQNCNIPSQFNISGPCTFKGNRVRFAYISNVRYAEIQDNHIYENLIFAGNNSTPIINTKIIGNNITPLNNAAHNAAIVFDGSAVTLDKVTFINNTIDLTKKSNIALQKGVPVNGRLNIENCMIFGNKAEQQVYWTAGNIINSLIDTECINIFNTNSIENSEVNFIGNTIIYYRENPFVIRDNVTVNYNINIINNNIIPIGYTATDLVNYVSYTFAGTIKSLGNNFLGKDPSTVGTYANRPTLTSNQIGRIYYMTDNSIPAFWNGEAWRDANGYPALKKKGTTAERPAIPSGTYSGYTYYDTTLNKYVLWNGTAWTNLDGTALT